MTSSGEGLKSRDPGGERVGEVTRIVDWDGRIQFSRHDKGGARDPVQPSTEIEPQCALPGEVLENVVTSPNPRPDFWIDRTLRVVRQAHAVVGFLVLGRRVLEEALGDGANLRPAEPLEHLEHPARIDASRRARQDQLARMTWVPHRVVQSYESAERCSEDDRMLETECVAEHAHIVGPPVEVPAVLRAKLASAVSEDALVDTQFGVAAGHAADRMREIVRRAILARLCLAEAPDPLWPLHRSWPVDAILADDATRTAWRESWHQRLEELGAGESAQPAELARHFLDPDDRA